MSSGANGSGPAAEPASLPRIVLTFAGVGAADMTMSAVDVSPAQLFAAAWYLDAVAREVRAGIAAKSALAGLAVAPASMLDELRRTGRV